MAKLTLYLETEQYTFEWLYKLYSRTDHVVLFMGCKDGSVHTQINKDNTSCRQTETTW